MHPYPHLYSVQAQAEAAGDVGLNATGLPALATAPPAEFDGPGDRWSPETLLVGAVADCFVLSFRAIARASKLEWTGLDVNVEGKLDRVEGKSRFTEYQVHATLRVPAGTDVARATTLLEKAEHVCLISNSLNGERHLHPTVLAG
ncbi:MAG: OsmC family protein [Gammaproteobacteria bacterium]|jgi:peroxiredoxin-like protein|nr:OsmC family protein [Gammaproteobacteria bacterium]